MRLMGFLNMFLGKEAILSLPSDGKLGFSPLFDEIQVLQERNTINNTTTMTIFGAFIVFINCLAFVMAAQSQLLRCSISCRPLTEVRSPIYVLDPMQKQCAPSRQTGAAFTVRRRP